MRGTGNMALPAIVTAAGAALVIPLSPLLIFGWGPFPRLGVAGGAIAVLLYYAGAIPFLVRAIWSGRNVLRPSLRGTRLQSKLLYEILRVGLVAAAITVTTNVTVALTTGIVALAGPQAIAGYGIGSRLEYLLIPLAFSIGAPLVAMVGTCIGAGDRSRALRAAWLGAAVAGAVAEVIGILAALHPSGWMTFFSTDAEVIAYGSQYLAHRRSVLWIFRRRYGAVLCFAGRWTSRVAALSGHLAPDRRRRRRMGRLSFHATPFVRLHCTGRCADCLRARRRRRSGARLVGRPCEYTITGRPRYLISRLIVAHDVVI